MNGISAIGLGIGSLADVNQDTTTTSAMWMIFMIGCNLPLTQSWTKQLTEDQLKYFTDNLSIGPDNPWEAAGAAADYAQYTQDQASMNQETGYQNTLVQNQKSVVRSEGDAMENVYNMAIPLNQVMKQTVNMIMSF